MKLIYLGFLLINSVLFAQSKKEQIELLTTELNDLQKQLDASRLSYSTYKSTFETTIQKTSTEISVQQNKIVELDTVIPHFRFEDEDEEP